MNTTIWILQGLLAFSFFAAGIMKIFTPKEKLQQKMPWVNDVSPGLLKFIGVSELLGALGLVLPMALNIFPVLTPIAASALAFVMLLAMRTHYIRKEFKEIGINVVMMGLAVAIGVFRF